ncbi:hypothetical protein CC86DRAFT_412035 [Ophiobolus disseminans]|uniref:Uncharacterized protein n=1 Tax=Ophiobolus disseminans TaxID=1469910 RepID=A0A6A6ZK90_9PLEO|nr:hypothetical protein CC86DRAFT_412035 [Ophiobolus disseminans]
MASATATPSASHDGDPDLANITNVTTSVEVGHVITVPHAYLKKSPVKIEWMQNMQPRSDTYYQVAFTNTNAGKAKYFLFISSDRIEDFRKLDMPQSPEDKIMVTVTTDFQYGQKDQIGKNRFLVYHHSDRCAMKQVSRPRRPRSAWNAMAIQYPFESIGR